MEGGWRGGMNWHCARREIECLLPVSCFCRKKKEGEEEGEAEGEVKVILNSCVNEYKHFCCDTLTTGIIIIIIVILLIQKILLMWEFNYTKSFDYMKYFYSDANINEVSSSVFGHGFNFPWVRTLRTSSITQLSLTVCLRWTLMRRLNTRRRSFLKEMTVSHMMLWEDEPSCNAGQQPKDQIKWELVWPNHNMGCL